MSQDKDLATQSADRLLGKTLALCRIAKQEKLNVTPARVLDIVRTLQTVDCLNEDDYRLAMRVNIAGSKEDEVRFERIFNRYWHSIEPDDGDYKPWRPEFIKGDKQYGDNIAHDEMLADTEAFGEQENSRRMNLLHRWDPEQPPIDKIIKELAKKLATRPSRREQQSKTGRKIDMRRSVRKNIRHGMDMLELSRVKKRQRKTRLVMLCDVSGSMDAFNPFLLQIMFGLQQELKNSRTLVFSTNITEITQMLRRGTINSALSEVSDTVRHWSGGTDIGNALAIANRGVMTEGSSRSTVAVIISDGYDNGETEKIEKEMIALKRRVRTIVWINPMYGASTFQVRASGLKAALPHVDHFLPAFNAESLKILVRDLARI
ncbi:MAG: vWA domain-containing protein [Gammaproteobacteria bacterium]